MMLCNMMEDNQETSYPYWPTKEEETIKYGKIIVTMQSKAAYGDFGVRKFNLQEDKVCLCYYSALNFKIYIYIFKLLFTIMSLIIQTIQLFKHPPFPGKIINYCIPSIRTPTFEIIIPISEHLHLAELDWGSPNVYKT